MIKDKKAQGDCIDSNGKNHGWHTYEEVDERAPFTPHLGEVSKTEEWSTPVSICKVCGATKRYSSSIVPKIEEQGK